MFVQGLDGFPMSCGRDVDLQFRNPIGPAARGSAAAVAGPELPRDRRAHKLAAREPCVYRKPYPS
jgi:hypothetical protein